MLTSETGFRCLDPPGGLNLKCKEPHIVPSVVALITVDMRRVVSSRLYRACWINETNGFITLMVSGSPFGKKCQPQDRKIKFHQIIKLNSCGRSINLDPDLHSSSS